MENKEQLGKIRNTLFYIGLAASVSSMLFFNFLGIFSFVCAVVAAITLTIGLILMIVIHMKKNT